MRCGCVAQCLASRILEKTPCTTLQQTPEWESFFNHNIPCRILQRGSNSVITPKYLGSQRGPSLSETPKPYSPLSLHTPPRNPFPNSRLLSPKPQTSNPKPSTPNPTPLKSDSTKPRLDLLDEDAFTSLLQDFRRSRVADLEGFGFRGLRGWGFGV